MESLMNVWFVVLYAGDTFAARSLPEAMDLIIIDTEITDLQWALIEAPNAGAARLLLGRQITGWYDCEVV